MINHVQLRIYSEGDDIFFKKTQKAFAFLNWSPKALN
jgi:hypothetical protein